MKIVLLNQFYLPDISPTAQLAGSLAEHRAARADDVTVLCAAGRYVVVAGHDGPAVDGGSVKVVRLWAVRFGKKRFLGRLLDYLSFYLSAAVRLAALPRQDVVVALTTPPYIALAGLVHKLLHPRTKLVLWVMDCYPEVLEMAGVVREGTLLSRLLRRANRFLFRRLDFLVCLDQAMLDLLAGRYASGPGGPPAAVVPNWEREALFPTGAPPDWEGRGRLGLENRFVVLYLGNAGSGHTFDAVLQAAEHLRGEPVTFLFVGGGSRWEEIERTARQRNLDNVVLRGYVPKEQTTALMDACHAALITLRDEARGLISPSKLHAGLAMGLPVAYVGPQGSNVDEAITRYECGLSVRTDDAPGLAAFIRRLRCDPAYYGRLRRQARAAFAERYCDRAVLPEFDRILDALGPAGGGPESLVHPRPLLQPRGTDGRLIAKP